jgi:putative aldouronate transport system substrate-binding protein
MRVPFLPEHLTLCALTKFGYKSQFSFMLVLVSMMVFSCTQAIEEQTYTHEQPAVIRATLNNILQDWEGQKEFSQAFFTKTGIELRITQPPHQNYIERAILQLNSSQPPDLLEILPEHLTSLIVAEHIIPLNSMMEQAENLDSIPREYFDVLRHPDGNLYGFPTRDGGGNVTYIRKDWLDNLGLPVPTTWDEMLRVLEAFTFEDPNRSGSNDTVGYTGVAAGSQDWYNRLIFQSGRVEIYYDDQLGRWIDGFTLPETREALVRLKNLYDQGIIDPALPTNTTFSARTRFINGQAGVFTYWANHWARNLQDRTQVADTPTAQVIPIPALAEVRYIRRIPPVLVITSHSKNPQLVFDWLIDAQYDKGPMQTLFTFGVEGFHWEWQDNLINFLPNPLDPFQANFTRSYVPPGSHLNDWDLPTQLDPLVKLSMEVFNQDPIADRQKWGGDFFRVYFQEIEQTLKPQIITSILIGERTIDQALEFYVRESQTFFLDQILAELNGWL